MRRIINNLKMANKLILAPMTAVFFLLVVAYVSYYGLSGQKTALEDIFNNRFKAYQSSAEIVKTVANIHANLYKCISWAGANMDAAKTEALGKEQRSAIEKTIGQVQNMMKSETLTAEEKKLYQDTFQQLKDYQAPANGILDMVTTDLNASTMFMGTTDEKYQVLNKTLGQLMDLETKLSKEKYDAAMTSFAAILKILIVVMIVAVVLFVLINVFMARIITQPIMKTIDVVRRVAEGDLTQDIDVDSKDEIGELASSVNTMQSKMGEAVGQSLVTAEVLSEAASEQAAAIEETSASLDEMASMTRRNASNTTEANGLMNTAKQAIQKANISMADLTVSMKQIASSSEQTQKIVKSIDEIAFQTNLLALNAAVEAARAGEAGAGFAVVADEVRNLAMRATEAARNTSELIDDIAVKVKGGDSLVNVTNDAFQQVTTSSSKVVELMAEIAAASQEQSQGIDQVNRAVAEMNQVTQQNAASAEELASIMSMFKTNYEGGHTAGASKVKRLPPPSSRGLSREVSPEKAIPMGEDDF
ncbi:MAG: methyl-accepting chemotaxis protein [Syntrophales bacterium]